MIAAATGFSQVKIEYAAVLPMLVVLGAAMVGVLVEAFAPRTLRYALQVGVTLVGLLVAFLALVLGAKNHQAVTAGGSVVIDGPALMFQGAILVLAFLAVMVMSERFQGSSLDAFTQSGASVPGSPMETNAVRLGATSTEVFPLVLFAVSGMMLFPASGDLLTVFIALEVLSLPLYILTGLARRRRLLSQEASMKYFLLGAFSSAFFLFGAALVFGFAGSLNFSNIAAAIATGGDRDGILIPGVLLVAVGLLFKIGAIPFHAWTPDAYQGAPTPVSGFMAACTKVAAFGAFLRVFYVAFPGMAWNWQPVVTVVAILTMVVGAVMLVTQTDIKRLLAYSSIVQAGFILVGVVALDRAAVTGTIVYVVTYGLATVAAFALVAMVRSGGNEATHLSQWAGLAKTNPVVGGLMALMMIAFAGIPLTSLFTAKYAIFSAAVGHGGTWLAVIGVVFSAVAAFVYVRVVVLMYFSEPTGDTVVLSPSVLSAVAITACAVLTVALGVFPSPLLDMADHYSQFMR